MLCKFQSPLDDLAASVMPFNDHPYLVAIRKSPIISNTYLAFADAPAALTIADSLPLFANVATDQTIGIASFDIGQNCQFAYKAN